MPRIAGRPERASLFTRVLYRGTRRRLGRMVDTVAVGAHVPRLVSGVAAFEIALGGSHRAPERLKALAAVKAAGLIGCPF
jgi:hypothetical protein